MLRHTSLSGGNSEREPPDPISNSEVKTLSADDSMGLPHVKVGHRQAIKYKTPTCKQAGVFLWICFLVKHIGVPDFLSQIIYSEEILKRM